MMFCCLTLPKICLYKVNLPGPCVKQLFVFFLYVYVRLFSEGIGRYVVNFLIITPLIYFILKSILETPYENGIVVPLLFKTIELGYTN